MRVNGHLPRAKVNVDRKHDHGSSYGATHQIHVRNSGLEKFGEGNEEGRNLLHNEKFIRNVE